MSAGSSDAAATVATEASGHGVQVVLVTEQHSYELDEAALRGVLLAPAVAGLPAVVVSLVGVYRSGKSFMLNLFLRYLKATPEAQVDGSWLAEKSEPLTGFSWRGGVQRNTTGILLWSEPIIMTTAKGEKVAVFLMDTQGTFDSESTVRDCSTIFALSSLLSSVQVYNLKDNIGEDDLQHLELFTEYGRKLQDTHGAKAFQVLEFLVRDWPYEDDYAYGAAGGDAYLRDKLKVVDKMPQDMKNLRNHIDSCFERLTCFLMPHPGLKVTKKSYKGTIADMDPEFREYTKQLVSSLFSPTRLTPKRVAGELVTARALYTYFQTYMALFNSDAVPAITTIVEATVRAGMLAAAGEAAEAYARGMDADCGARAPSVPEHDLLALHAEHVARAHAAFAAKRKMGSRADAAFYRDRLDKDLDAQLPLYGELNIAKTRDAISRAKEAYEAVVKAVAGDRPLCVHATDLDRVHQEAYDAAKKTFDAARKHISVKPDKERDAFLKSFEQRHERLRLMNRQNNEQLVATLRMEYWMGMQEASARDPPPSAAELRAEHDSQRARALAHFEERRSRRNHYTEDVHKYNLDQDIENTFENLKKTNASANKALIRAVVMQYKEYMAGAWDKRSECLHPRAFAAEHQVALCRALAAFRPGRDCSLGFVLSDPDERALSADIDLHYWELKKVNETANESAVQDALGAYCESMEELCRPSLWWLLIVPIFIYAANKNSYHDSSVAKAMEVFYNKRRVSDYTDDDYLKRLRKLMDDAYYNY